MCAHVCKEPTSASNNAVTVARCLHVYAILELLEKPANGENIFKNRLYARKIISKFSIDLDIVFERFAWWTPAWCFQLLLSLFSSIHICVQSYRHTIWNPWKILIKILFRSMLCLQSMFVSTVIFLEMTSNSS